MEVMIVYLILLLTALPVGGFLAWLCRDEIFSWRKVFLVVALISFVISILLFLFYKNTPAIFTLFYLIILALVAWKLSYRRGFPEKEV